MRFFIFRATRGYEYFRTRRLTVFNFRFFPSFRAMSHCEIVRKYGFQGLITPLPEIADWLRKYGHGSVNVVKNMETGIATIQIDHAAKKNCLSGKMMVELFEAVEDLEQWKDGVGILIYGAGGTLCSGADLDVVKQISNPESGYKMATLMQYTLNKLKNLPMISVCFIGGAGAIGGGAEISTACDYRLMVSDSSTKIGFVHAKLAIAPAWGGLLRLANIVGSRKALDIVLKAKMLTFQEAMQLNLVDEEINSKESAEKWLLKKIELSKDVIKAVKLTLNAHRDTDPEILDLERRLFANTWGSSANKMMLAKSIKHK